MNLIEDIKTIQKLAKIEQPKKITIIIAKNYKYELFKKLKELQENKVEFKEIIKTIAKEFSRYEKDIAKKVNKLIKNIPIMLDKEKERKIIEKVAEVLKNVFKSEIEIVDGETFEHKKSNQALPLKPAILIE